MEQEFLKPQVISPEFEKEATYFYESETSWQTMVQGRVDRKGAQTKSYECNFSYSSDTAKSAQLQAGMQGIGLDLGGLKEEHMTVDEAYTVEFY